VKTPENDAILTRRRSEQHWGIIFIVTAMGVTIAGMLIGEEGILGFAIAMAGLGIGLILAQVWSDRIVENPPKAAL
jgi:quinol-cytochrome oxidoreductase complex cytochrome b subunit